MTNMPDTHLATITATLQTLCKQLTQAYQEGVKVEFNVGHDQHGVYKIATVDVWTKHKTRAN